MFVEWFILICSPPFHAVSAETIGKEGILTVGSWGTGGDREGQGKLYRRGYIWTRPWNMTRISSSRKGLREGLIICASGSWPWPHVRRTLGRTAQPSSESLIMEWIKHKKLKILQPWIALWQHIQNSYFPSSTVRLAFHILGCHILGNTGTTSQPALLISIVAT